MTRLLREMYKMLDLTECLMGTSRPLPLQIITTYSDHRNAIEILLREYRQRSCLL